MSAPVSVENLNFLRGKKPVLSGLSFELAPGSLVGLMGHNGAGKSTLIKLILGLLKPSSGDIRIFGERPGANPLKIGYLPENVQFYDSMTLEEHMAYFSRLKGVPRSRSEELLERLALAGIRSQKASQCSKGQRQRLGLAQALLTRPNLLLLDEPTVGLDAEASSFMYQELKALKEAGCTVLVCTHEISLIEPFVTKALLLCQGKKAGEGTVDELCAQAGLPVRIEISESSRRGAERSELQKYLRDGALELPEDLVPEAIKILTEGLNDFSFRINRPNLKMVYEKLVQRRRGDV